MHKYAYILHIINYQNPIRKYQIMAYKKGAVLSHSARIIELLISANAMIT